MKHRVSELEGRALDMAVALAEGYQWHDVPKDYYGENAGRALLPPGLLESGWQWPNIGPVRGFWPHYSTDPACGLAIIEREGMNLERVRLKPVEWLADFGTDADGNIEGGTVGPTLLIAAMRAYVVSKLGEEIELPDTP